MVLDGQVIPAKGQDKVTGDSRILPKLFGSFDKPTKAAGLTVR
jgi:hypothetical protein